MGYQHFEKKNNDLTDLARFKTENGNGVYLLHL